MACNQGGGLSGAFIPVSEDEGMIAAVKSGLSTLKLEAIGDHLFCWSRHGALFLLIHQILRRGHDC